MREMTLLTLSHELNTLPEPCPGRMLKLVEASQYGLPILILLMDKKMTDFAAFVKGVQPLVSGSPLFRRGVECRLFESHRYSISLEQDSKGG